VKHIGWVRYTRIKLNNNDTFTIGIIDFIKLICLYSDSLSNENLY